MAKASPRTIGEEHAAQLGEAFRLLTHTPLDGARDLPVLIGLHSPPKPIYVLPQDNVILSAICFLTASGKVYAHGSNIVYETDALNGNGQSLRSLRTGDGVDTRAEPLLANVFTCADGPVRFPPPRWFVKVLLSSDLLSVRLPRIRLYANRPVFDRNFQLCSPGWNPDSGFLIHGPAVEPDLTETPAPSMPVEQRLPTHLRTLLAGFCFRDVADVVNTVSMLLTGMLANHFVESSKGVFLIDGNQPGLGKTLLARAVGTVLDGIDPQLISYSPDDEEIQKKVCAVLRGSLQSMVFIDNAKAANGGVISSPVIEANSMAPEVTLRILGKSENFTRPNDLLWVLTMNDTRVSPDLSSRGVPIRLAFEGRPEQRAFPGPDPLRYAREHRLEILGELVGMVVKWNQAARPQGPRSHRCHEWAGVIGGILNVAGFPEFLANADDAAASFNVQLDELAALAEAVVANNGPFIEVAEPNQEKTNTKLPASKWLSFFGKADLLTKQLAETRSEKAKVIKVGQFLAPNVGRKVPIQVKGRGGHAILRLEEGRSNSKRYYFEIVWDVVEEQADSPDVTTRMTPGIAEKKATTLKSRTTKKCATQTTTVNATTKTTGTTVKSPKPGFLSSKTSAKPNSAGNDEAWE